MRRPQELFLYLVLVILPTPFFYALNHAFLRIPLDNLHFLFLQLVALAATPNLLTFRTLEPLVASTASGQDTGATKEEGVEAARSVEVSKPEINHEKSKKIEERVEEWDLKCEKIVQQFLFFSQSSTTSGKWESVYLASEPPSVQVFRSLENQFCYKILAELDCSPRLAYQFLCDILSRPSWDPMTASTRIIKQLSPTTRIQYLRTNPVWPTSARDMVLLSHMRQMSDGSLLNVTQSVDGKDWGVADVSGVVRMIAGVAGQIVFSVKGQPEKCKIVQILNGDPMGWIPKSVVSKVATTEIPRSFRKLARIIMKKKAEIDVTAIKLPWQEEALAADDTTPKATPKTTATTEVVKTAVKKTSARNVSDGSDSTGNVESLMFRIRRLETQLTHLLGVRSRLPGETRRVTTAGTVQRTSNIRWLGKILGGVGFIGVWAAAIAFALKRNR